MQPGADVIRGALAGAVGGLIASWAMESFQAAWTTTADQWRRQRMLTREGSGRRRGARGGPDDPAVMDLPQTSASGGEPATVKVASAVVEPLFERELTSEEKPVAGEVVHYGFGMFMGALYGALAEIPLSPVRLFNGMLFGTGLWLVMDEVTLPELGLQKASTDFPSPDHAYRIASHLVYGFTLETVRRMIRWMV